MTIKAVAHHLQVSWDTIKDIQATSLVCSLSLAERSRENSSGESRRRPFGPVRH